MNEKEVCCVIVTYNIGNDFIKCYSSIENQVDFVVIIDNGSNSETIDVLKKIEMNTNTFVIYNNKNLGIACALNQGIKYAIDNNYKWVLTMDNDSKATEFMVKSMLNSYNNLDDKDDVVSLFPQYVEERFNDKVLTSDMIYNDEMLKYIDYDITSGNLLQTKVFEKVGFFKEEFFIDYVDIEFCLRIREFGYKLIKVDNAKLIHNLGKSEKVKFCGKEIIVTNHMPIRRYYITRNRIKVWKLYNEKFNYIVRKDKMNFFLGIFKIILLEKHKLKKIKMIYKGIIDAKNDRYNVIS